MKDFRLKEKNFNYYDEFIKNANIAIEISTILKKHAENYDINNSTEVEEKVHKLENDADKNLHETIDYLVKDFLPPIEREDIVLLVNKIDDIIDYLDEIAINFNILNIVVLRDNFLEFMELFNKVSVLLKEMLENFKDKKKHEEVYKYLIEINNIEENGDRLYEKAIKSLFTTEKDPIEIIKWNTIYNTLENGIDSFESVANTIGEIVLKKEEQNNK